MNKFIIGFFKFLELVMSSVLFSFKTLILAAIVTSISYLAPKMHKFFLRHYAGSKVVMIVNKNPEVSGAFGGGTGFHVKSKSGKTYLVTNRHVCDAAKKSDYMYAAVRGTTSYHRVKIIEKYGKSDLCLVEPIDGVDGLNIGSIPRVGQYVAAIGHPNLQPRTFTEGEVVGTELFTFPIGIVGKDITEEDCNRPNNFKRDYWVNPSEMYEYMFKKMLENSAYDTGLSKELNKFSNPSPSRPQKISMCFTQNVALVTTAMIYHGSSGSPVLDFAGNVVGVMYSINNDKVWGRAITLLDLNDLLDKY